MAQFRGAPVVGHEHRSHASTVEGVEGLGEFVVVSFDVEHHCVLALIEEGEFFLADLTIGRHGTSSLALCIVDSA